MKISASLLSCDLLNIQSEIELLNEAGIDCLHIDVMDGHYVPNIAFGIDTIKQIAACAKNPITVHLMIDNPDQFVDVIAYSNIDYIVVHSEGIRNFEKLIEKIKIKGVGAGLAINPQTQVADVGHYLKLVDIAVVMGVHPGFGGQTLISSTLRKIQEIKSIRNDLPVAIDGGINDKTFSLAANEKVDILVVGSYLFSHQSSDKLKSLKEKLKILCSEGI